MKRIAYTLSLIVLALIASLAGFAPYPGVATAQSDSGTNPEDAIPGLIHTGTLDDVTIYGGLSVEEKQAKITAVQTVLADAIFENFAHMDTRLGLIMDADPSPEALQQERDAYPFVYAYDDLTEQVVVTGNADAEGVRRFIAQMVEADYAAITVLDPAYTGVVDLSAQMVQIQSQIAFAEGILVLVSLSGANPGTWDDQLATFTYLYNGETVSLGSGISRLNQLEAERARLVTERTGQFAALLDVGDGLEPDVAASLAIQPDDTPEMVVNKAIALRDLGQITAALAVYDSYAAMFAATDPGAELYATVAKQFTLQRAALGVPGGAYMVAVAEDSAAYEAGLAAGDIVVEFNEAMVRDDLDLWDMLQARTIGDPVEIMYLRLDTGGMLRFHHTVATGTGDKLGIWFIVI